MPDDDDDVQGLADWLGRDLHTSSNGSISQSASETVAENQRGESDASRGASGGCNQDADNVPDSNSDD